MQLTLESLATFPWKNQWTHPCQAHPVHPVMPPIQPHCHHDGNDSLELVMTHINYRVWAKTSQSHLGDDPMKHHWQQGQGLNHLNPLGSVNTPRPAFAALILEQLFHSPQGLNCPTSEWKLTCLAAKNVPVSSWCVLLLYQLCPPPIFLEMGGGNFSVEPNDLWPTTFDFETFLEQDLWPAASASPSPDCKPTLEEAATLNTTRMSFY